MEKLIYLIERHADRDAREFASRLLDDVAPGLSAAGASDVTVTVADLDAEMDTPATTSPRIVGPWPTLSGAVHFWLDTIDDRARVEERLAPLGTLDGYLVTESIVQPYERTWAGRTRRPGVAQFSVGRKPAGATEEHFYHHWQDVHSPFSFKLHPHRWSYVRNAVARPLTAGAAPWRFIVLEHWRELREFTDETLYYGGGDVVAECWRDVPEFLDMDTYASGPMSEYHFD